MISLKEQESLLVAISARLKRRMTVFAIGGTAMMLSGTKEATKDIDLVFTGKNDISDFVAAAKSLGYESMEPTLLYGAKENQPTVLKRLDSRIDLFTREIISFTFSEEMESRAVATHEFGSRLVLRVADPHDIIILKAATDRIKDKDDIRSIIQSSKIDWDVIVREAAEQVRSGNARSAFDLLGSFLTLRKAGVDIPESIFERIWDSIFQRKPKKRSISGKHIRRT